MSFASEWFLYPEREVTYQELLIVLVVVLVLFGGPKIPELMRGVGRGIEEFKAGVDDGRGGGSGPTGYA
ncbi:MAG: twin-arginine translocase TatA/TatE family subunit [Fimbriimonas sp.]